MSPAAAVVVEDLTVRISGGGALAPAVDHVDLTVGAGETVGLVGESGSGKTMLASSLIGLQPGAAHATWRTLRFGDRTVAKPTPKQWRAVRGSAVTMVFQDSRTALSPVLSIGTHLRSTLQAATGQKPTAEVMAGMLARVGISAPEQRLEQYPHQLSGGIRQRVAIALALAWQPRLLIADEPTTALDVTVQRQVVELLEELQETTGMAILFVSHDLGVVTQLCETIAVMYAGRIVERGPAAVLVEKPEHPYTEGLLRALPQGPGSRQLDSIPGAPPTLGDRPSGCPFHPRCPAAMDRCRTERPPLAARTDAQGEVACWLRFP